MSAHKKINEESSLFRAFESSEFRSTKHTNYFYIYDDLLKKYFNKKITFVEVGIASGGSLFMWKKFFKENARIIGIDFNPSAKKWEKYGFEIYIGNQSSSNFWKKFYEKVGKIDVLIDDGGHTNEQQLCTFLNSYKNINNDGLMLFEDTHASYMSEFGNPSKYSFINFCKNILDMQNQKSISKKINYNYLNKIHKIDFFQSIVAFHFDEKKAEKSDSIINKGKLVNSEDYRSKDIYLLSTIDKLKNKLRDIVGTKFYNTVKKIYPYVKFFVYKIKNIKNKRFFNKD